MRRIQRIEATNVVHLFGATPALRGVDLSLECGTITILAGPNGAGKSTLLSILGTRLSPSRGRVGYFATADGEGTTPNRPLSTQEVRAQLGWVSHESHCYRELSGRQNIELAARLRGVSPAAAWQRVRERVGLGRFAERSAGTLSRGQLQRVALARALVHEPSLLLLDEPWTGLDAASGRALERVVCEECARGALVVIVSHAAGLGERLGANTVWLRGGRLGDRPSLASSAPATSEPVA